MTRPTSTYRVQVRPQFDIAATTKLVPYLASLGATHLYSAPLLAATPGSVHGYDVIDPTVVNPALGGAAALDPLVGALRGAGLGLIVDIVPNHVGVTLPEANPAWWSLLRDGPGSPYARWFDVDWSRGPLVIPVLAVDGEEPDRDGDALVYGGTRYPIAPGTGEGSPAEVHARQHYRLVWWRRGDTELTYRRFFAIAGLAGIRVEDPEVFEATHAEVLRWLRTGLADGLRVDHPDGLADPAGYLRRLRAAAPAAWIVVEKICGYGESLPPDWPVDGGTGYDALREVCGVFVDPDGERPFTSEVEFGDVAADGKRQAATGLLATELTRLERLAPEEPGVRDALAEIAVQMPVYRSYLPHGRANLDTALDAAAKRYPEAIDALRPVLTDPTTELARRFPQYTGAVMAKGVEDMAYYRWTRFCALNEVGGEPDRFGVKPDDFHAAEAARQEQWPAGMTTLSTHDTKRSEDVRARLAVLAEVAPAWQLALERWTEAAPLPDASLATLLWQTAVGAWPIERERFHAYAEKAAREAGQSTTWADPDEEFEARMHAVVDAMYDDPALRASLEEFVAAIEGPGRSNSLGQKILQLAMPGIPDVYQGTELWDFSLVDPDNRRPVDFAARHAMLVRIDAGWLPPVDSSGGAKLLVTSRALRLRRDRPELFTTYRPVLPEGPHADHAIAFDRGGVVAVATRLPVALAATGGWTEMDVLPLPDGVWHEVLTGAEIEGGPVRLGGLLAAYPVALLVRDGAIDPDDLLDDDEDEEPVRSKEAARPSMTEPAEPDRG